jgi:hypothetical protein
VLFPQALSEDAACLEEARQNQTLDEASLASLGKWNGELLAEPQPDQLECLEPPVLQARLPYYRCPVGQA